MIITNLSNLDQYRKLGKNIATAIDFLQKTDLNELELGRVDIDGDKVFGNCFEYRAEPVAEPYFEAHQKYTDLHIIIKGQELVYLTSSLNACPDTEYSASDDVQFFKGRIEQKIHLDTTNCLIAFPEDIHQPKVRVDVQLIKKLVLKIKVD